LKKRARLIDNDPLSPTDEVLLGFQHVSQSTSQQVMDAPFPEPEEGLRDQSQPPENLGMSASQPVDKPTSQPANQLTRQLASKLNEQLADLNNSQPVSLPDGQLVDLPTHQPAIVSNGQPANPPTCQPADLLDSQPANVSNGSPVDLRESQQVNKSTLRKSTFQLTEAILQQLDVFHLHLQLELGKAKAPYKEVIVEEAICQLLATRDRQQLLTDLQQRQSQRSH
jgi:hypothetical protein